MPNPLVLQGTLNRLRGNLVFPVLPQLNVTASFLGKEGINVTFEGSATTTLPTMTGGVQSPEPYQLVRVAVHLLKSQSLAAAWEAQRLALSLVGDAVFTSDSSTLPKYLFSNVAIANVDEIRATGDTADFPLMLTGFYFINALLWDGDALPGS